MNFSFDIFFVLRLFVSLMQNNKTSRYAYTI